MTVRYVYAVATATLLSGAAYSVAFSSPGAPVTAAPTLQAASGVVPRGGAPASFADMVERLQPAVVNISTRKKITQRTIDMWGRRGEQQQDQQGGGSGFFISSDGLIVTNNHVIASTQDNSTADEIIVTLTDQREYPARIIGRDLISDIAILKIEASNMPFVQFGDSGRTRVGDWVVAIGNPFGLGSTVTAGIVSAMQRNIGAGGAYDRFIQTDTAINMGNSGGPLFNMQGQVIGINNRLIGPGANIGINFAIPAEAAIPVVNALRNGAAPTRGYLGVQPARVDEDMAAAYGLPRNQGEMVNSVTPGEPAEKAGLKPGDIVLKVAGRPVTPQQNLSFLVANQKPGTRIPLEVFRDGKTITLNAVVGTRPSDEQLAQQTRRFNREAEEAEGDAGAAEGADDVVVREALGMQVLPLTPQIIRDIGVEANTKGVVISAVVRGSEAAGDGLRRGDVILSAQGRPTTTPKELADVVRAQRAAKRPSIVLEVRRSGIQDSRIAIRLSGE